MKSLAGTICKIHNEPRLTKQKVRKGGSITNESYCRSCKNSTSKSFYYEVKDTEEFKATRLEYNSNNKSVLKNAQLRVKYGITYKIYQEMLNKQNHCCGICKRHKSEFKQALAVDHCHVTNKVRGLLCTSCNNGLGRFKDSVEITTNAASYLATGGI